MALAIATLYVDKKQKQALMKDNTDISLNTFLSLLKAECTRRESWKILENITNSAFW